MYARNVSFTDVMNESLAAKKRGKQMNNKWKKALMKICGIGMKTKKKCNETK